MRRLLLVSLGQEEIGRRIKAARESAGLSQQELAERIGLKHAQQISKYERGLVEVRARRIGLIAKATGKTMEFFVSEREQRAGPLVDPASWIGTGNGGQAFQDEVLRRLDSQDEMLRVLTTEVQEIRQRIG